MSLNALYAIIDRVYVGHGCGQDAMAGITLAFPIMMLFGAFGVFVGAGHAALLSIKLGEGDRTACEKILGELVAFKLAFFCVLPPLVFLFLDPILRATGGDGVTPGALEQAKVYLRIVLFSHLFSHLAYGLSATMRSEGAVVPSMMCMVVGFGVNLVLDPIFIFGLGMGIKGAAVATVLCQLMALCYTIWFFSRKNNLLHFGKKVFELEWDIAKASLSIGMGPFLMNAAACIVNLFINQQLGKYGGDLSIGAYGLANRLTFIFLMINMGLNQGMQPIAGFNFGARQYSRVKEVFWSTTKWMTLVTLLCFIVSEFLPEPAIRIFTDDPELVSRSVAGIRLMNMAILVVGFGMASGNLFQCLGMVKTSIFLSLTRQLLFLVPLLYVLPLFFGEKGVWYSFPISDVVSTFVAVYFVGRLFRKFGKMKDGDDPSILGGAIK